MRTSVRSMIVLGVLVAAGLTLAFQPAWSADVQPASKIFEQRIYITNPGKLPALNARFRDHTCQLFKKHGIELIGFWTPTDGEAAENTLIYLVAFPSVEAQKQAWKAFQNDPEWKQAKADSEKDGVLVKEVQSKNLKATDYSPIR